MNEQVAPKLWIIKFCLKVIYPKYNLNTFLVYLAIKTRILLLRSKAEGAMDTFSVKTAPYHVMQIILKEQLKWNKSVLEHKCVIISKEQYIQFCAENLFYVDHGALWLAMKLAPNTTKKKEKLLKENQLPKLDLGYLTSEIHKKLWKDTPLCSQNNVRIVPVVHSNLVPDDIAYTTENEYYNIVSSFGLENCTNIVISFHPVPSIDCAPKIAASAEVSLIVNDYDLSNDFVKEVLSNFFEQPKLLSINDIFSIDLKPTITADYHFKYLDLITAAGKLFFKCRKFSNGTESTAKTEVIQPYFIVRGVTQLTLGENIHILKPKDEFFKQPHNNQSNLSFHQLCPTGLRIMFDKIQETIMPFLNGELNELSLSLNNPIIPMILLSGTVGSGRHLLVKILAKYNGLNCLQIDCNALQSSTAKQTESKINSTIQKAKAASPIVVLLDNFEVLAVDPENNEDCRLVEYFLNTLTDLYQNYTKHAIIFIAVTERVDLKPNILRMFLDSFHIPKLNVEQRYEMLEWFASVMKLSLSDDQKDETNFGASKLSEKTKDVLQRIAAKTETFLYGDLDTLVHFALRESYLKQYNSCSKLSTDPNLQLVKEDDFNCALEAIRSLQSQHLDAPKIPKVYWEDIGGLENLKRELLKTIEFPIKYPHLFKSSTMKRSGILLYGPPGCGKTLVAKAVSTELNISFLSVKGPELLNMYIGQSEENVRKVFEAARASSPCIVFLDELDALAPRRGAAGDAGGASDRVVSQLLAELDGVTDETDTSLVFIMGATNRADLLEQSLLRPGRLDKRVYVGPYTGTKEKTSVLRALTRGYRLRPEVDLEQVSLALPWRVTGADLRLVVDTARAAAVRALVALLNDGKLKESELSPDSVILGISELYQAVESFRPSVTDEELSYYDSLQSQM